MIKFYIENKAGLAIEEKIVLNFHTGQMLALNNQNSHAIHYLKKAYKKEDFLVNRQWNCYLNGTIAFLRKDQHALERYKNKLIKISSLESYVPNLPCLKSFLKNFTKPYLEAYSGISENN
jgi:hypothetical protein